MGFPILIQAPLSGYTDSPFRKIVKDYGVDVVYSEMISSAGIVRQQEKTLSLAYFTKEERPIFLQLFGAESEIMKDAASIVAERFSPDGIDINMGCPVKKVVKSGAGAALLRNTTIVREIVKKVKSVIKCPLSVKIRSGWDEDKSLEIAKVIEDAGADIIAIHPRTREQFFSETADWKVLKNVKSRIKIPVIGNGNVQSPYQAKTLYEYSGVDGIMIGRASLRKPYIFSSIKHYFEKGIPLLVNNEEIFHIVEKYVNYECTYRGEGRALKYTRKMIIQLLKGRKNSHRVKNEIFKIDNKVALLKILRREFSDDRIESSILRN